MSKNNNRHPGSILRNILIILLLVVMVVSGIGLAREYLESKRKQAELDRLAELASQTTEVVEIETETEPETEEAYVSPIDFDALKAENPDTIGWIRIPGTEIDYPIVYDGDDNETYLHKDFYGNSSPYGAIYLDADSEPDFSGWNNPIYGHHMRDGSMFKDVVRFKEKDYFKEHQFFEIYTPERTIHLKAVSCYYSSAAGIVRQTRFKSQESFDEWVMDRLKPCSYAEIPDVPFDSMFVLVTCSYEFDNARTLLFAVEVDEEGNVVPAEETGKPVGNVLEKPTAGALEDILRQPAESGEVVRIIK